MKKAILLIALIIICVVIGALLFNDVSRRARAQNVSKITIIQNTSRSAVTINPSVSKFSLVSENTPLYTTPQTATESIHSIIYSDIALVGLEGSNATVQQPTTLVTKNLLEGARLTKHQDDASDPFLKKLGIVSDSVHYSYQQRINGIPVYGSYLTAHIKHANHVYALMGTLLNDTGVPKTVLTENQATEYVQKAASKDLNVPESSLKVVSSENIVFNPRILDIRNESANYPAIVFVVSSDLMHGNKYIVSLLDGEILHKEQNVLFSLNREIRDCHGSSVNPRATPCQIAWVEGNVPPADTSVKSVQEGVQVIYDQFKSRFNRDSYDGNGAKILASINSTYTGCGERVAADWADGNMVVCGTLPLDYAGIPHLLDKVLGHELGHALLFSVGLQGGSGTAGSSAVHEGLAEVLGDVAYPENESSLHLFFNAPYPYLPLNMYDDEYVCGLENPHANDPVTFALFYAMEFGTSNTEYNGCKIPAMGKTKALNIAYRMITTYLTTPFSNFLTVATGLKMACNDLYGQTSRECAITRNAVSSSEMDQQLAGDIAGPKCTGVVRKPPVCETVPPEVTPSPSVKPTNTPTITPTLNVTTAPTSGMCLRKTLGDANCDGNITVSDFTLWKSEFLGKCSNTNLTTAACGTDIDNNGSLMDADNNGDGKVSVSDFTSWKTSLINKL